MEQLLLASRVIRVIAVWAVLVGESVADECVTLNLIVALPNLCAPGQHELVPSWERGEEIVLGARIAVKNVNNKSEFQLELINVDNGMCGTANNFNLLQQSFEQLVNHSQKFIGVVGLSCNDKFQFLMSSVSESGAGVVRQVATLANLPHQSDHKIFLIRALFRFMKAINWRKLGVITETGNTYFSHTAEMLYREAKFDPNINVVTYQQLHVQTSSGVTHLIQNIMSKITFISVNLQTTVAILCSAYQNKLLWPNYVFVLHSYLVEDFNDITHAACNVTKAFENILFVREQKTTDVLKSTYEVFRMQYNNMSSQNSNEVNPNAIILHNLVITVLNQLNLSEPVSENMPKYRIIEITQCQDRSDVLISIVYEGNMTVINDNQIRKIATVSDEFEMKFEGASTGYTIIFSVEIIVGFMFVTIMLIAYVYFRNEPEVKSTSFMLSLLIFLGCYLNLIVLSLLLYLDQPVSISKVILNTICGVLPWISGLGVSTSLIIATVLVKLARVYHIFNRMTPKPLGKKSSDLFLAGYVLLILFPVIVVLTTWTVIDRFKITFRPSSKRGFFQRQCFCDYLTIWIPLLVLNVFVLFLVLMIVALTSRHIREKHFRHTRRVNMFIFFLFFNISLPLSYWWLLENLGTSVPLHIATIPLHIGHFGTVVLCQLLLIAPKLLTPFSRCLCGK